MSLTGGEGPRYGAGAKDVETRRLKEVGVRWVVVLKPVCRAWRRVRRAALGVAGGTSRSDVV